MLNIFQSIKNSLVKRNYSLISFQNYNYPKLSAMNKNTAIVKHFKGDPRFTLSFHLIIPSRKINKQFNLNRELEEDTHAFLGRLVNNINKVNKLKDSEVKVNFSQGNGPIVSSEGFPKVKDFIFLKELKLKIEDHIYNLKVNPPLVRELKLSDTILANFMIYPYSLELDFADDKNTKIEWFTSQVVQENDFPKLNKAIKKDCHSDIGNLSWTKVGEGYTWTPDTGHINTFVRCQVTPCDQDQVPGEMSSVTSATLVTAGPDTAPIKSR